MIQRKTLLLAIGSAVLLTFFMPGIASSTNTDEPTIIAVGDIHGDYEAFHTREPSAI